MWFRFFAFVVVVSLMVPAGALSQDSPRWLLSLSAGAFSPTNDELQNIYGTGYSGKVSLATPLGTISRLKLSASRFERDGDPFYRSGDFNAGNAASLSLTSIAMTLEAGYPLHSYPRVYIGGGLDYVFAEESIVSQNNSDGSTIGAHISVSPEIRLAGPFILTLDASYRFLEMTFKSGRDRYRFDLSGTSLLAGIGFGF